MPLHPLPSSLSVSKSSMPLMLTPGRPSRPEKSAASDRSAGTSPVFLMLKSCTLNVPDCESMKLSCIFLAASVPVPDRDAGSVPKPSSSSSSLRPPNESAGGIITYGQPPQRAQADWPPRSKPAAALRSCLVQAFAQGVLSWTPF